MMSLKEGFYTFFSVQYFPPALNKCNHPSVSISLQATLGDVKDAADLLIGQQNDVNFCIHNNKLKIMIQKSELYIR
jgi:hypothetical protein